VSMAEMDGESGGGKLAKNIRSNAENDEISLDGYSHAQVNDLVQAAFGTPIPAKEMFRIQFVVGGGKKCRQRFSPDLPKQLADALRGISFQEDRGASAVLECQGTYKRQHDTDKDLIFMHVFPHVEIAEVVEAAPAVGILDAMSPEHLCTVCSLEAFKKMVNAKTPSLSQRRKMLKALKDTGSMLVELEERMAKMEVLSPPEEQLYGQAEQVEDKCQWLQGECEAMIDAGKLTAAEAKRVGNNMTERLAKVKEQLKSSEAENKPKMVAKLQAQVEALEAKLEKIAQAQAQPVTYPLKGANEMVELRVQLLGLDKIANSKQLLDVNEVKKLHAKPQVEEQLAALEDATKEWFQDDDDYNAKLAEVHKRAENSYKAQQSKNKKNNDGWATATKKGR